MPAGNQFAHQSYSARRPRAPYQRLVCDSLPVIGSEEYRRRMQLAARRLRAERVGAVVLVHGTFVGDDPFGLYAMLFGGVPKVYRRVCRWQKRQADRFVSDIGNYPLSYLDQLATALDDGQQMPVHRFVWSGMNNHVGRAVAAVQLIGYLTDLDLDPGERLLLWGHSHGGNVLALLTNLLSESRVGVADFLGSTGVYARTFENSWSRLESLLQSARGPLAENPLDLVTMGMPIRYGFETTAYAKLLHFVNHRSSWGMAGYRTTQPASVGEWLMAKQGDYVHQLGIAGSNFATPLSRPLWTSERLLAQQLTPGLGWRTLRRRMRLGMRVPEEGQTLLVDYGLPGSQWLRSGLGHCEYTHRDRMLLHVEQIVRRFYPPVT